MYEFEKLEIWQGSLDLIEEVYELAKALPKDDLFGLKGQLARAALSVALNIAEGKGSGSDKEFRRFLSMSRRSIYEIVAALRISIRLKALTDADCQRVFALCDEVGAKTNKFISKLS